jgi:hypothetical protein
MQHSKIARLGEACSNTFQKMGALLPAHVILAQILDLDFNRPGDLLSADRFLFEDRQALNTHSDLGTEGKDAPGPARKLTTSPRQF